MLTSRALLVPHLPTLLVDEHRGHRTEMLEALAGVSERLLGEAPDAAVVLSARWEVDGPFLVDTGRHHRTITDYPGLGVEVRYDCVGHPALARALVEGGQRSGVHVAPTERGVDSGVTVPMHFLVRARNLRVVPLSLSRRSSEECRAWGRSLRAALEARKERVVFVVGGMLSFNQHAWSLKREVPESRELDERILAALRAGDWASLSAGHPRLFEQARPEAALRHLEVMRGFLSGDVPGAVVCYEAGPGVGAALMEFGLAEPVPGGSQPESGRPGRPGPT